MSNINDDSDKSCLTKFNTTSKGKVLSILLNELHHSMYSSIKTIETLLTMCEEQFDDKKLIFEAHFHILRYFWHVIHLNDHHKNRVLKSVEIIDSIINEPDFNDADRIEYRMMRNNVNLFMSYKKDD